MSLGLTDELLANPSQPGAQDAPVQDAPKNVGSLTDQLLKGPELRSGPGPNRAQEGKGDLIDDPKMAVPLFTVLKASIFPDDNKKLDFLSQETGIPRQNWGVVDGNIVYADPKTGSFVRAIPSVSKSRNAIDLWQRATKWAADQVGPSIPGAAGGAVGVAMGPTGMSIPAAGAVSAGVDAGRQMVGNAMLNNDTPVTDIDWLNSVGQGLLGAGGQAIPTGAIRAASRNPMKISPYDRSAAMDPATVGAAGQRAAEGEAQGIPLSFGQSTGLRSSLSAERQLARDPASMDTMDQFYTGQREKIGEAVQRQADSISPVQDVESGVSQMREGAQASIKAADDVRKAKAGPLYEKALDNDERFWIPELDPLMERPSVEKGIGYAKLIAKEEGRDVTVPVYEKGKIVGRDVVPDWRSWDYIKRGIDQVIEENTDQFGKMTAYGRTVVKTKNDLMKILDEANPEYAAARKAFQEASPDVTELRQSGVGKLATKEGDEKIGEIRALFNANLTNPGSVNKARVAFEKAGRIDDWNAGVATWLKDALDASTKTNKGGVVSARDLVSSVYRDENQKKLLKAALTPDQFDGLSRLMNVIQDVAQTMPEGSATATDIAGGQALRAQFGKPVSMAKGIMNLQFGEALLDRASLRLSDSGMAKLAEAVTNPNNVEQLKKLRMMDPRSEKALIAATQLLGVPATISGAGGRDARGKPPQRPQAE